MLGKIISSTLQLLPKNAPTQACNSTAVLTSGKGVSPTIVGLNFIRLKMRYHFQYPSERRRILRQGFWARMATPGGRKIIMRRLLKGKHFLSH